MTAKTTTKRNSIVLDADTKWFQRGFDSKDHYQGWLQFNDLIDEGYGFDDVYHDDYTGKTTRISASSVEKIDLDDEATQFLVEHEKQ